MIERYAFGQITIDGQTYTSDVIIAPGQHNKFQVWDGWWREEGHCLSIADLEKAFARSDRAQPDVLLVGTGHSGRMKVPSETREEIQRRGIELHVLPTGQAWTLYNQLASGGRKVVAVFHLTC
jgi:hypothetical protein